MNNGKPPIEVSHDLELVFPSREKGFVMTISEWKFVKAKIQRMKSSDNLFLVIANICLGASASNAYLIKFTKIEQALKNDILIGFIFTLAVGVLCLLFHFLWGKEITLSKKDILADMERIEKTYSKSD